MKDTIFIIDGHHGQYVPKLFAEMYPEKLSRADRDILQDPDQEEYWETWAYVRDIFRIEHEGASYFLHQAPEGDLFLLREGADHSELLDG